MKLVFLSWNDACMSNSQLVVGESHYVGFSFFFFLMVLEKIIPGNFLDLVMCTPVLIVRSDSILSK